MTDAATDPATIEVSPDAGPLAAVEVTIEGDKSEVREVSGETAKPTAREVTPEAGIDELKRSLSESRAREQAEASRRQAAEAQVADAGRNALDANIAMVASEIEAAKAASKEAFAEARKAMEKGDYEAALDAQRKLTASDVNMLRLQERKAEIEAAKTRPAPQPQQQDPVEAIASQLSPQAGAWMRAHPEMAKQWDKVEAAHMSATRLSGLVADTPEYFAKVEDMLGIRAAPKPEPEVIRIRQPSAQAPAQRETVSLRSGQPERVTITLSSAEREQARYDGLTDKEYAMFIINEIKEGRMKDRS